MNVYWYCWGNNDIDNGIDVQSHQKLNPFGNSMCFMERNYAKKHSLLNSIKNQQHKWKHGPAQFIFYSEVRPDF